MTIKTMIGDSFSDSDEKSFQFYFKCNLRSFCHPLFGFDIVKFDEWLHTPDDISTHQFIEKKYGKAAMKLISDFISPKRKETTNENKRES